MLIFFSPGVNKGKHLCLNIYHRFVNKCLFYMANNYCIEWAFEYLINGA